MNGCWRQTYWSYWYGPRWTRCAIALAGRPRRLVRGDGVLIVGTSPAPHVLQRRVDPAQIRERRDRVADQEAARGADRGGHRLTYCGLGTRRARDGESLQASSDTTLGAAGIRARNSRTRARRAAPISCSPGG